MNENNEYRQQRIANLQALKSGGVNPYGNAFRRTGTLNEIRLDFVEEAEVEAAGRITALRSMGKTIFADLRDGTGHFQLFVGKNILPENLFDLFQRLDIGDHIGVQGVLFTTRRGEKSIRVNGWTMLSKALLPLPEKWHGLRDTEARYRQRYLDLISNPDVRERFNRRSAMIWEIRSYLHNLGFQEVETPMMQPTPGGAAAKPFVTRYDALNVDMYLRIAPELYLKRLLVGGFDRVFELNRNFRNEGLDRTHNPEFTMLEIYKAYADLHDMKQMIEDLILRLAETIFDGLQIGTDENRIDLTPPWREVAYADLITEQMGADWYSLDDAAAARKAAEAGLSIDPSWNHLLITHEIYEKLIEKNLRNPTFVTRLPSALIPLAKACEDNPDCAEVFELVIAGQEIAPAYTEQNDPEAQRERLESQAGEETERTDNDFLTALEHGMPPAGGMGVGIDRLCMILSGAEAIRDVILFPQLRPRADGSFRPPSL